MMKQTGSLLQSPMMKQAGSLHNGTPTSPKPRSVTARLNH